MALGIGYIGSPVTSIEEIQRQQDNSFGQLPSVNEGIRISYGQILEVHTTKPWVRVVTATGSPVSNGDWIPVNHGVDEIVERFGTLRTGMKVSVTHTGPEGRQAAATIIGTETEAARIRGY